MRPMRILLGAAAATVGLGGCGGGSHPRDAGVRARPVAEQLRQALTDSLKAPALPDMVSVRRPRLPFVAVSGCTGPAAGAAGRYTCATTPRGRRGVRSVAVHVRSDGSWSTDPIPVQATLHGHGTTAVTGIWGAGIRLP
jgi:hypothetical protein